MSPRGVSCKEFIFGSLQGSSLKECSNFKLIDQFKSVLRSRIWIFFGKIFFLPRGLKKYFIRLNIDNFTFIGEKIYFSDLFFQDMVPIMRTHIFKMIRLRNNYKKLIFSLSLMKDHIYIGLSTIIDKLLIFMIKKPQIV